MAREIKFRSKATNILYNGNRILHMKGDWLYGDLIHQDGEVYIAPVNIRYPLGTSYTPFRVQVDTLGQYTGLKDKNGVEIYEGDIVKWKQIGIRQIKYFESYGMFGFVGNSGWTHPKDDAPFGSCGSSTSYKPYVLTPYYQKNIEVVGNIHENPELLNELI